MPQKRHACSFRINCMAGINNAFNTSVHSAECCAQLNIMISYEEMMEYVFLPHPQNYKPAFSLAQFPALLKARPLALRYLPRLPTAAQHRRSGHILRIGQHRRLSYSCQSLQNQTLPLSSLAEALLYRLQNL